MVNLDYLYNPAAAKPYFDKNYFVDKKLGFQTVENGISDKAVSSTNMAITKKTVQCIIMAKYILLLKKRFSIAPRLSFILECFFVYGDIA